MYYVYIYIYIVLHCAYIVTVLSVYHSPYRRYAVVSRFLILDLVVSTQSHSQRTVKRTGCHQSSNSTVHDIDRRGLCARWQLALSSASPRFISELDVSAVTHEDVRFAHERYRGWPRHTRAGLRAGRRAALLCRVRAYMETSHIPIQIVVSVAPPVDPRVPACYDDLPHRPPFPHYFLARDSPFPPLAPARSIDDLGACVGPLQRCVHGNIGVLARAGARIAHVVVTYERPCRRTRRFARHFSAMLSQCSRDAIARQSR